MINQQKLDENAAHVYFTIDEGKICDVESCLENVKLIAVAISSIIRAFIKASLVEASTAASVIVTARQNRIIIMCE